MTDAIQISNLHKTFGPKVAVDNLSLSVPAGSLCGFIGPNGAGKTTTIRMIMSIIFPDSGTLSVLGRPSAIESKDRIGYLPEERGVYRKMRVASFLTYMARLKGVDAKAAKRQSLDWLEKVGLGNDARKRCDELSKGMQQKVQFIAAVIHKPELIILDEVFSGLDPANRRLMRSLIDEQHQDGRTIVFSTHAMYEAEQLCDRVFMIHRGVKTLDDTIEGIRDRFDPRTIIAEPARVGQPLETELLRVQGVDSADLSGGSYRLRVHEAADPYDVLARVAAVAPMRRVELARVTLEDVFIDIVTRHGDDAETVRRELHSSDAERSQETAA